MRQNLYPLIPEDRVRAFASDESTIHFLPPPFFTVSALLSSNERYWTSEMACPSGISFEHSVVIGDFGLGSDAPIVLDYRTDPTRPGVIRLCFGETFAESRWVTAALDFDAMCEILHIEQP